MPLKTVGSFGVSAVAHPCEWDFPSRAKPWVLPGPRRIGRYLLAPLTRNKEGNILRDRSTPIRFPTNISYTPVVAWSTLQGAQNHADAIDQLP